MNTSFLFICGCPRSGTTALWRLLVSDQRIRLGVERYGNRFYTKEFFTLKMFEEKRFFTLEKGDTFYPDLIGFNNYYETARDGYSDAVYHGDKIPKLYEYFDRLDEHFPTCRTVFIYRNIFDVAASYKARRMNTEDNWNMGVSEAINDWNTSLMRAMARKRHMAIVDYEGFFVKGEGLQFLYDYLELDVTGEVLQAFENLRQRSSQLEQSRPRSLSALEVREICDKADFNTFRAVMKKGQPVV